VGILQSGDNEEEEKRAAIYRMMRITDWEKHPKLKELLS
jgi:hypothetical protein